MLICNEELKKFFQGVYTFEDYDEYLAFYRFSEEQIKSLEYEEFYYDRSKFTASERLVFMTKAEKFSFDYKIVKYSLQDTFDVYVNSFLTISKNEKEMSLSGTVEFFLPKGEKEVELDFPMDSEIHIKNFRISDTILPVDVKKCKVLWLGDSIMQGAGGFMGGQTFVNIVTRKLNYDSLNQGIGGYGYYTHILKPLPKFIPDKIIVALGTNDVLDGFEQRVDEFYDLLKKLYPSTPKIVITPLWRGDLPEKDRENREKKAIICKVCLKYPGIKVIDGYELVPHFSQCFWDNLHPNAWGYELFANNFIDIIKNEKQ